MRDPSDDRAAVERPQAGAAVPPPSASIADQHAVVAEFTAFYLSAAPKLVAFLRWHGASMSDAADCAQDALALAFHQWSTLRHPYTWTRTVASRRYARTVATIREDPVEEPERAGSPLLPSPATVDEIEQRHTVLALLPLLEPRQRQVMAWTYDGATPAEIAEALQMTSEAVRTSLYEGRKRLRQMRESNR